MDKNVIITYLICLVIMAVFSKMFSFPLKLIIKIIVNSILGGILIYIVNLVGGLFNFHLGLNIYTAIFASVLGIPGVILLIILKILLP